MNDLHSIGALLRSALGAMGLEQVDLTLSLMQDWDEIAGSPWAGASNPLVIKDGVLIVEAASSTAVRFLRYSVGDLMRRLDERFGEGVVNAVTVRPPPTR
ncbi:MAG: DUF721 domain-containing protein [Acidimicrobiia bacterium]|nr:DUF721 domain-containing protein [Acidimicrobiia bacterium]